jgi:predicted nucleic acid-binding protein
MAFGVILVVAKILILKGSPVTPGWRRRRFLINPENRWYYFDNDNIIACAVAAKADYLVTGDFDLLNVKHYKGIKIISPRDFEALFI